MTQNGQNLFYVATHFPAFRGAFVLLFVLFDFIRIFFIIFISVFLIGVFVGLDLLSLEKRFLEEGVKEDNALVVEEAVEIGVAVRRPLRTCRDDESSEKNILYLVISENVTLIHYYCYMFIITSVIYLLLIFIIIIIIIISIITIIIIIIVLVYTSNDS